ncbi:MAG: hypothetical protein KA144_13420 [Xanthomonadaceae bacterium]|nr:hypothetical protein [Xanthomonadaceae bacterium]
MTRFGAAEGALVGGIIPKRHGRACAGGGANECDARIVASRIRESNEAARAKSPRGRAFIIAIPSSSSRRTPGSRFHRFERNPNPDAHSLRRPKAARNDDGPHEAGRREY